MRTKLMITVFSVIAILFIVEFTAHAQPYGAGKYNSNTGYGSETALSISATSGVNLSINPTTSGTLGTASGTVTVYSTDVTGYKLYIRAINSTAMTKGTASIPASANVTAGPLAVNTWGYNTTATSNFLGMTNNDALLKSATGPYSSGDTTTVTYGLNVDLAKAAGAYATDLIYTAVPQTN